MECGLSKLNKPLCTDAKRGALTPTWAQGRQTDPLGVLSPKRVRGWAEKKRVGTQCTQTRQATCTHCTAAKMEGYFNEGGKGI